MKNKKIILIVVSIVLVGVAVLYYFNKKNTASPQAEQNQEIIFNNTGLGLTFDKSSGQVKEYNPDTSEYSNIATLKGQDPLYLELSPDQKSFFYSTDPNVGNETVINNPDSDNVTIKSLNNGFADISLKNIFSPHWFDANSIIYQTLPPDGNGEVVIQSTASGKITKKISIGDQSPNEINVLDTTHVLVYEYASDVGETSSKILDLNTQKLADSVSGNGLRVKSIAPTKLIAYQIIANKIATTHVINWSTNANVVETTGSLENVTWTSDSKTIIYVKNSAVVSHNVQDGVEKELGAFPNQNIVNIQITPEGKLFIKTDTTTKTLTIN